MNEIKVIDNFCNKELFEKLQSVNGRRIPWEFDEILSYDNEFDDQICDKNFNHQYVFNLYELEEGAQHPYFQLIKPILDKLQARCLMRAKINAISRENEIIIHGFHQDFVFLNSPEGLNNIYSAILYLNTNNGFTVFQNGKRVESVANRMVIFPAKYKHSSTTCTDTIRRMSLNIVYF